jgi:serine/threonine-protein kinase
LLFEDLSAVPNVIPILDSGETPTHWALVMPRAGKSLRDHLSEAGGALSVEEVVTILSDLSTALAALESNGVVHRDLKPENILLYEGRWCLADFGIARYAEASTSGNTRKMFLSHPYAAPEQWRFERVTAATDIYALGVVAYELLAGQRPFPGPSPAEYREQHLHDSPPALPDVPAALAALVSECLYKAPQSRPTATVVRDRLKSSLSQPSASASRLQAANQQRVDENLRAQAAASAARTEEERRAQLHQVALASLAPIFDQLSAVIEQNAPTSVLPGPERVFRLGNANLLLDPPRDVASDGVVPGKELGGFVVTTYAAVRVLLDNQQWGGRAHSLWYCDAAQEGVFRWFETAFFDVSGGQKVFPFPLPPHKAVEPLEYRFLSDRRVRVAWPFMPMDQGDESQFIERWMGWFADAAQGVLQPPHTLPPPNAQGSWRWQTPVANRPYSHPAPAK